VVSSWKENIDLGWGHAEGSGTELRIQGQGKGQETISHAFLSLEYAVVLKHYL